MTDAIGWQDDQTQGWTDVRIEIVVLMDADASKRSFQQKKKKDCKIPSKKDLKFFQKLVSFLDF